MRSRTLMIPAIFALAGLPFAFLTNSAERSGGVLGEPLFERFCKDDVSEIIVTGSRESASIAKAGATWVLRNRYGYPADLQKVSVFLLKCEAARVGWEFEATVELLRHYGLESPEARLAGEQERGPRVVLKNPEGEVLQDFIVGAPWIPGGTPEGHYVRLAAENRVRIVDTDFIGISENPKKWLDRKLIELSPNEITGILCSHVDGNGLAYSFRRVNGIGGFEEESMSENHQVERMVLKKLEWAMTYLELEDVLPGRNGESAVENKGSVRIDYRARNGLVYRVFPGGPCPDSDLCHLRIDVEPLNGDSGGEPEDMARNLSETRAAVARELNRRLSPWTFAVSKAAHSNFITDLNQLIRQAE